MANNRIAPQPISPPETRPHIGYACLAIGVPGTDMRTCQAARATPELLDALIAHNLRSLGHLLDWNARNGIRLFRVSSDLIPFGSSPVNPLPWWETHAEPFALLAETARTAGIRLSMHPGQYTVLNAKDPDIVRRAVADLAYHERVLSLLGSGPEGKIILHVGGVYGDRTAALQRFIDGWRNLDDAIRSRLVIENDEKCHPIGDVLALGTKLGIPVVYDNLHNALLPTDPTRTDAEWIAACASTWRAPDGRQKIHYSQQAPGKHAGSHSSTIDADAFLAFAQSLAGSLMPDIMLEVKDKNRSALKCALCLAGTRITPALEHEWARYKYTVLEHAPNAYRQIRHLFASDAAEDARRQHAADVGDAADGARTGTLEAIADKAANPVAAFYRQVDQALREPVTVGNAENAALHVWGYFKDQASRKDHITFFRAMDRYRAGTGSLASVKRILWSLAETYKDAYLLDSLYFHL